jgi:RNA polymerase sigma factor (sigma-70 family)
MDRPNLPRSEATSLIEALERMGPKLRRILFRYRIPTRDADDLLQETLLVLVSKQESVRNPEAWLQATLSNRCILYWRRRRSRVSELVDRTILELLDDPAVPEEEAAAIRSDLDLLISRLPERCQLRLRRRYGLVPTPDEDGEPAGSAGAGEELEKTRRCLAILAQRALGAGLLDLPTP